MKIGLFNPMHKPNDFQILYSLYTIFFIFFLSIYIGKNRSRLASKKGLFNHKRNPNDF